MSESNIGAARSRSGNTSASHQAPESLAAIVHRLRREVGLTLQELGSACDLAPSTLSKIENDQMSPTYDTILRLANGLGIDVAELFAGKTASPTTSRRTITRRGEGLRQSTGQYDYEMLCAEIAHKQFVPLLTTVKARSVHDFPDLVHHAGEEFIYVVSGQLTLLTEHYAPTVLGPGDSVYFDSTMGHACVSSGEEEAVMLWVCSRVVPPLSS